MQTKSGRCPTTRPFSSTRTSDRLLSAPFHISKTARSANEPGYHLPHYRPPTTGLFNISNYETTPDESPAHLWPTSRVRFAPCAHVKKKGVSKGVKRRDDVHPWRLTACVGANTMVATVTHTVDRNPWHLCSGFWFYIDARLVALESQ